MEDERKTVQIQGRNIPLTDRDTDLHDAHVIAHWLQPRLRSCIEMCQYFLQIEQEPSQKAYWTNLMEWCKTFSLVSASMGEQIEAHYEDDQGAE